MAKEQSLTDQEGVTVSLVEKFGFDNWEIDPRYPLPDLNKRLQIRSDKHYAPTGKVKEIRAALTRGEEMPPIIVTRDGHVIDGNTRVTAARLNGFPHISAVVLDVDFDEATGPQKARLFTMGAAFNARHGQGIDREEIRRAVDHLAGDPAYSATRIAALIGVTERSVSDLINEKKAVDRAKSLGIKFNGAMTGARLRALGSPKVFSLNDEPFKEVFALTNAAALRVSEINDLSNRAKETKSDAAALEVIQKEREGRKEQIAEFVASGRSKPPTSAKLRQRLGFIVSHAGDPSSLVEHNPNLVKDHVSQLEKAVMVLQAAIKFQEA